MTFRTRLTFAFGVIALVPLLVFGYGVRREMTSRLDADAARRVASVTSAVNAALAQAAAADHARLRSLAADLAADNRFRIALVDGNSAEHRWLLDWARNTMQLGGLAILQVQDSAGRILSSGQFRNDFDRLDPALPAALAAASGGWAIVSARTPDGTVRALASIDSFAVGTRRFTLVGGRAFDSIAVAQLSRDPQIAAALVTGAATAPTDVVSTIAVPYFDDQGGADSTASLVLTQDLGPTRALREGVNRWLLITLGSTLIAAMLAGLVVTGRMSKPIADLASKTVRVDLDRLDQKFNTGRDDEIGALERLLDAMTARLRTGATRLRETERLAATGELARQINHDIKNGLAPIRNVLRHLTQTAEQQPGQLASVYVERQGTLESSVQYLEELARNYARLSPSLDRSSCEPGPVARQVAGGVSAEGVRVQTRVADGLPKVRADAVVLRRILENLVSNAVDALDGKPGDVTIAAEPVGRELERRVRFVVSDTGRGMTRQQLDRAFDDFYTTKPTGTGLGLSVVRRLLTDLGGSIKVETAPGQGSTFTVDIPAA
ncbi:MAG TPA: HAMP domain-containing sensor histidine kinase [Gemmatimonadaceae bacterium]|nr:HAMP domain-containing sensor histidine kinase [Gemmatimonadaceae bacterium]